MVKSSKQNSSQSDAPTSQFIKVVERYIKEVDWSNQELMNAIKVGETQFYRWRRGSSVPRKVVVNRIAVALSNRMNELEKEEPSNPFPGWDRIDRMLNELLEAAGYSASLKGRGINSNWDEIASQKAWTLGYTKTPISDTPDKAGAKPKGKVIDYAEQIGRLLGLHTQWEYLSWDEMPCAVREKKVDAIAPLMLILPERLFDYRFSNTCSKEDYSLSAVLSSEESVKYYDELGNVEVKLIYVKGEIGEWGVDYLGEIDKAIPCQDNQQAITKLTTSKEKKEKNYVFFSDNLTCEQIAKEKELKKIEVRELEKFKTHLAFAFHPDEPKLINAINSAIGLFEGITVN